MTEQGPKGVDEMEPRRRRDGLCIRKETSSFRTGRKAASTTTTVILKLPFIL